jgi:hypothetical protein
MKTNEQSKSAREDVFYDEMDKAKKAMDTFFGAVPGDVEDIRSWQWDMLISTMTHPDYMGGHAYNYNLMFTHELLIDLLKELKGSYDIIWESEHPSLNSNS